MKENSMTDRVQQGQTMDEPSIVTYDAEELTTEVAFANTQSNPRSDRNLKENLRPVDPNQSLRGIVGSGRKLDDPDVATYDKAELTTEIAFAGNSHNTSDRNLKDNLRPTDSKQILAGVVGGKLDDPEVTTFDKAELTTKVAFAGGPSSPPSDRNLKENLRSVDADHTLQGVVGAARKLDDPEVSTYDKTELTTEVAFAGGSGGQSDRNLKDNFHAVESKRILSRVVGGERQLDDPEVATFDKAELTTEVAFAGGSGQTSDRNTKENVRSVDANHVLNGVVDVGQKLHDPNVSTYDKAELTTEVAFAGTSGGGSDRNIKENFGQTEPKQILSRIVGDGKTPAEPRVTTYDRVELTARTVFTQQISVNDSARDLKENFGQTEPKQILSRIVGDGKTPAEPRVTTYDRVELTARTVFTVKNSPL